MENGAHLHSHNIQKKEQQSRPSALRSKEFPLARPFCLTETALGVGEGWHWPREGQAGSQTRSMAGSLEGPGPPASPLS